MAISKLAFLSGIAGASAFAVSPLFPGAGLGGNGDDQLPLGGAEHWDTPEAGSEQLFTCDLPPVLDPSGDGLPSADELFSGPAALAKQVERHQAIVRVPSVSYDDLGAPGEDPRWAPFYDLHETLASVFPNVHRAARVEKVNTLGLVYTLQGSDPSLKPTLLAAHLDVVPVADASTWTHPPFAAVFDGEWLWGRGSGDDKNSLTALLSAVEALLGDDVAWTPTRTLLLAFGFDEECSGNRGAGTIGAFLTERYGDDGIAIVLDEGGLAVMPVGGDTLYALPAVHEKGHVDVYLELSVAGGHSSIPLPHTGIGIVAEIVSALEANPYEPALLPDSPVHRHMQCLARYSPDAVPEMTDVIRRGDLESAATLLAGLSRAGRFMIQTAQAVDVIKGGQKINALPEVVTLGVNYRVAPQDSIPAIQRNFVKSIGPIIAKYDLKLDAFPGDRDYEVLVGDEELVVRPESWESSVYNGTLVLEARDKSYGTPVSPTSGPVWDTFAGTIRHRFAFEGGTVVPVGEIMTGNTDTRHYLSKATELPLL